MKKIYFLVVTLCFFTTANAQIVNIPDANFKAKLLTASTTNYIAKDLTGNYFKIDTNSNGEIEENEALNVSTLNIQSSNISSLNGIDKFNNLVDLNCILNNLTVLDLLGNNKLEKLNCYGNDITNLNVANLITLKEINCGGNQLVSLNLSGLSNLKVLDCSPNRISNLNLLALTSLEILNCSYNVLTNLELSDLSNLKQINFSKNALTNINLTGLVNLERLDCLNNILTTLNITSLSNLRHLDCSGNQLTNLDLSGSSRISSLFFAQNKITAIDLSKLPNLFDLRFYENQITAIDFSGSTNITSIDGGNNPIESIDLSRLPYLTNLWLGYTPITTLDLSKSKGLYGFNVSSCPNLESINLKNGRAEDLSYIENQSDYYANKYDLRNFSNCPKLKYICGDKTDLESISQKIASYNYTNCEVGLCTSEINSPIVNIPDANFKAQLLGAGTTSNAVALDLNGNLLIIDANEDGEIEESEALQVKVLAVDNSEINSLEGIRSFTNLYELNCSVNQLQTLDLSGLTNLHDLYCNENQLQNLDLSGLTNLHNLYCYNNQLNTLNISGLTNLFYFNCDGNQLQTLDLSSLTNLDAISCNSNQLQTLNVSGLTKLTGIYCDKNQLQALDLTGLINLSVINCVGNQLQTLDVSNFLNLSELICSENKISNLNLKGLSNLEYLSFFKNQITAIDFPDSSKITYIQGGNNPIEEIDLSQLQNLKELWLGFTSLHSLDLSKSTQLTGFNVSNCPNLEYVNLKNSSKEDFNFLEPDLLEYYKIDCSNFSSCAKLKYICADESDLESISQKIVNYNYTNCNVGGYCSFDVAGANYTIQGSSRIDSNNNGCEVSDLEASNVKFTISDGTETGTLIANESGNYSINVKGGTYTITPSVENPDYFTVSPTSVVVDFPTDGSSVIRDFCIIPIDSHKDLEVTLIPLEVARPGFDSKYKLTYKNKGNVAQSGTVNLAFDDAVLDLVVANPVVSTQTVNNLSWNFSNLKPFETREIAFTLNANGPMETPAVNSGSILNYTATINSSNVDETPNDNTFVFNHVVVGSLDPNDKTCLEGDVITPNLIGEYVHYLIRFENTGDYAAQNIVVKDIIDLSKFDISTLVPTDASHSYITKISESNKVEFIFENVNLPFDDANNDGYIAFKIKTLPTLTVGDSFENTANIFFDYNFPVETNTAKTTYKTLGTQDFEFSNYFTLYPNPAKSILNISLKETIEIQSINIYNTLGQLVLFVPNAEKVSKIDVSNLTTGNYFIKINSDKGTSNTRFIKE